MNPSKPASRINKAHKGICPVVPKSKGRLATYPLLGILLVIVLAMLAYGGLYFLFLD